MKKILSFIIAVILVCSCFAMPVSAQEKTLETLFRDYCRERLEMSTSANVRITDTYDYQLDVTYFTATSWVEPANMGTYEVIGEYCVHSNAIYYPYHLGVYVATNDEVYDLKTAYDEGIVKHLSYVQGLDGITVHEAGEDPELTHKCMDAFARYKKFTPKENEYVECKVYGEAEGSIVFQAHITSKDWMYPMVVVSQRIGGYIFYEGYPMGPADNPVALYVLKGDKVMPLSQAYENYEISLSGILSVIHGEKEPDNIDAKVAEKLNFTGPALEKWPVGEEMQGFRYREQYAYFGDEGHLYNAKDPDYVLLFAAEGPGAPAAPVDIYGEYVIGSYEWHSHYRHGYYVYIPDTDTLYTLKEAVEADVKGIENAFLHLGKQGGIRGDADKDGKITVKDATFIQKGIAGVKTPMLYYENVVGFIMDFDADTRITVRDATCIQKYLAGIEFITNDDVYAVDG